MTEPIFERMAAANFVATLVQRGNHFSHKLGRFGQHLLNQVGVQIGMRWQGLQLRWGLQGTQQDERVVKLGLVAGHGVAAALRAVPR